MQLVSLRYSEFKGQNQEWILKELTLGSKNLVVGKNSAGKTRALHVIASLARTLSTPQNQLSPSGNYHCKWIDDAGSSYVYEYIVDNSMVVSEGLTIDDQVKLKRDPGGVGEIYFADVNGGMFIPFQAPVSEFAIVKRRDALQHPFIEPLYQWAAAVRHYFFGSPFGKENLAMFTPSGVKVDDRDGNQVVGVFRAGKKDFGKKFTSAVIRDMAAIGYQIDSVDHGFPVSVRHSNLPPELNSVFVKEKDVPGYVDQLAMSQGMYRVLALLIHVNYLQLKKPVLALLLMISVKDSTLNALVVLFICCEKADESGLQIIMSTNDKFVMNEVPLKEWTVLHRRGSTVYVNNYCNSAEKFDDFRFTGLSNFSFSKWITWKTTPQRKK